MQCEAYQLTDHMEEQPLKSAIQGQFTVGPKAAEKLCAVEGVEFAPDADLRAQTYAKMGLTPAQRRAAIIQHYKAIA